MTTATLERPALSSDILSAPKRQDSTVAFAMEELARLRFSIVLTARWEVAERSDMERRDDLRRELARLRGLYFERIDEMAMTFGVQQAMDAKDEVERRVFVPRGAKMPGTPGEDKVSYL